MSTMIPADSIPVLGRHSPRLAALRRIGRGEDPRHTAVDGEKLVSDLAAAGVRFELLLGTPDKAELLARLATSLPGRAAEEVLLVPAETLERVAVTRHPQGILGIVEVPHHEPGIGDVVLYLDRLQDPGNVGAVIRCAAAFGVASVACSPGSADPFSPRAVRASAGQALLLPVCRDAAFAPLAEQFRARDGEVVATVGRGGQPLSSWHGHIPLLLALGNEGQGLDPEVLAASSHHVTIPLRAGVESLNVAVTAGVVLASLVGLAGAPILELKTRRRAR